MEIRPIQTEEDYKAALAEVSRFFDAPSEPEPGTTESDRLEILVTLIEAHEAKIAPIGLPDPIGAIEFDLDRLGLTPDDLIPIIGSRERVAAILEKRQSLTLPMIHRLSAKLNISVAILAQPYSLQRSSRRAVVREKFAAV